MNTQVVGAEVLPEQLVEAWRSMLPGEQQQLLQFAEFLVQQRVGAAMVETCWVDRVSGSMKDRPEFDVAMAYGRTIREEDATDLLDEQ